MKYEINRDFLVTPKSNLQIILKYTIVEMRFFSTMTLLTSRDMLSFPYKVKVLHTLLSLSRSFFTMKMFQFSGIHNNLLRNFKVFPCLKIVLKTTLYKM